MIGVEIGEGVLPCGLCGRQVGADNVCVGELVADFDGPDSGARADVEDVCGVGNWGEVEFVVHQDFDHLVCEVKAVEFVLSEGE